MNIKGPIKKRVNNSAIRMLDIMNRLRIRTQNIRIRKEESIEELNSLRRIMNLPDNISELDSDEIDSINEEVQELRLNL